MSLLESIFYMMWRGIAIGIIISAPMGPVGILCIQRTLDKGRHTGFYTGIGAALSDLFYCLITGFGLSLVEEFLEKNQNILQLAGSVLLIVFGIYLLRKDPMKSIHRSADIPMPTTKRDILYGFLFTVSNPLIIFLIIGLFARFNFMAAEMNVGHLIVGYIFIFLGALTWWWLVSFFVDKVRAHFSMNTMLKINKIIGFIILMFAAVGIATSILTLTSSKASAADSPPITYYYNPQRGYDDFQLNSTDPYHIILSKNSHSIENPAVVSFPAASSDFTIKWRTQSLGEWHISLFNPQYERLTLSFTPFSEQQLVNYTEGIDIAVSFSTPQDTIPIISARCTNKLNCNSGLNSWQLKRIDNNTFSISGGDKNYSPILSFQLPDFIVDKFGFSSGCNSSLISYVSAYYTPEVSSKYTPSQLDAIFKHIATSSDNLEGIWQLFDSSFDTSYIHKGGDYKLAIHKSDDNAYELIYLSDATINKDNWKKGMIKARLIPSKIKGIYDVEWFDSYFIPLSKGLKAQTESSSLLSINFPYHNTTIRLHRVK